MSVNKKWKWVINNEDKSVTLVENGNKVIMDFIKWGLQGATPRFNINGLMEKATTFEKLIEGREHHANWHQEINHEDAKLIEIAPEMKELLIDILKDEKTPFYYKSKINSLLN